MSARDDYPNLFVLARTEAGLFTELLILEAGSALDELDYLHAKLGNYRDWMEPPSINIEAT